MHARVLTSVAFAFFAAASTAGTSPPIALEPSSQWIVDYADNNCRLVRMFGTGKSATKLVFEQVAPRSPMTVMLVGKIPAVDDKIVLSFEPLPGVQLQDGQRLETVDNHTSAAFWPRRLGRGRWGLLPPDTLKQMRQTDPAAAEDSPSAPAKGSPSGLAWKDHDWNVEPDDQWRAEDSAFNERANKVSAIVLSPGRSGSISLHTGALAKPFQALEQCASDSLKDWGIDPATEATVAVSSHPLTDAQHAFSSNDYPKAALSAWKEDTLEVWLNIDTQGQITNCRVISDFATPEINGAICGMIQRKEKFVPARRKDGTPVPDFFIQSFVFRIA
jgi:hypothetical protein